MHLCIAIVRTIEYNIDKSERSDEQWRNQPIYMRVLNRM